MGVRTFTPPGHANCQPLFQSLGWVDGCSDSMAPRRCWPWIKFQSLGWVDGCSDCAGGCADRAGCDRFNPSAGLMGVRTTWPQLGRAVRECFNPSAGLMGVRTLFSRMDGEEKCLFQSLGWVDGCSDIQVREWVQGKRWVSIPRLG